MIVGFDFGTTNSLISIPDANGAINIFDVDGNPFPSVVRYEGQEVTAGRDARLALEELEIGVYGNIVHSPKFLLGEDIISVGGVERNPIDIVADLITHVRKLSESSLLNAQGNTFDRAVVTIPVTMNGRRRAALREAFNRSGISIAQFVHEPLAALYGYLSFNNERENLLRKLANRYVLVIDWGGGTLDLTLCRLQGGSIVQLRNGGSDKIGGDFFDKAITEEVVRRFSSQMSLDPSDQPTGAARRNLRPRAEKAKIELSTLQTATVYSPNYFAGSGTTLEYELTRSQLDEIVRPLVAEGIHEVEALLDSASIAPAQVSMCLVVGGMAAMPSIRSRLHEMFGPQRVIIPEDSATLVAQGSAWIAYDEQRLRLAKDIELEMARGSRLAVLKAGTPMPYDGEIRKEKVHLYCSDPTDGIAKFSIVTPSDIKPQPQSSDPRTSLGMLSITVDKTAPPLVERLELDLEIDDNLILLARARSSQANDVDEASFFDLEFGIALPGMQELGPTAVEDGDDPSLPQGLWVRTNVSDQQDRSLVPGDVLYKFEPSAFSRRPGPGRATTQQEIEHLYYQPCAACGRSWGDVNCRCASGG